jgi:hypothetical protein
MVIASMCAHAWFGRRPEMSATKEVGPPDFRLRPDLSRRGSISKPSWARKADRYPTAGWQMRPQPERECKERRQR